MDIALWQERRRGGRDHWQEGVTWWSRFMAHLVVMDHLEKKCLDQGITVRSIIFGRQRRSTSDRKGS